MSTERKEIEKWLLKIEQNAKEFEQVPEEIINDNFIIQAIQKNTFVVRFISGDMLNKDRVAFAIALIVPKHKKIIKSKLEDNEFYFNYICQKIKNKDIDDVETYINKDFFSTKENVIKVLNTGGAFKLKHLHEKLRDNEEIVDTFCNLNKTNQIWASERIKEAAAFSGIAVSKYVKNKLFYEKLNRQYLNKKKTKVKKI